MYKGTLIRLNSTNENMRTDNMDGTWEFPPHELNEEMKPMNEDGVQ